MLAFTAGLLIVGEAVTGAAGPVTSLALALGAGLALMEAGARLARGPRAATFALAPLVLFVLVEPLIGRVEGATWSAPTLGPVPPHDLPPRWTPGSAPTHAHRR